MVSSTLSSQWRKATPAEEVAAIDDLLTEILRRLPTKTVLQFKLVSKHWLSLISSTYFSISHTRFLLKEGSLKPSALFLDVIYRRAPTKLMFLPLNPETKELPVFNFMDALYLKIIQSCNGLLLCSADNDKPTNYFICNPVTKKFRMINFPRPMKLDYQLVGVNLAFDPIKSPHYKVVLIWHKVIIETDDENNCLLFKSFKFFMDIYDSETDYWSLSENNFTSHWDISFDHAVFLNGAIHWDSFDRESLYFDVENNSMMPLPMPRLRSYYSGSRYFGASGSYLQLAVGRRPDYLLIFRVYEMLVDHSGWFLKYRIDLDAEMQAFSITPLYDDYEVVWLAVHSDEDEGDSMIAMLQCGVTVSYNFSDEKLTVLPACPETDEYQHGYDQFRACAYYETLACV